MKKRFTYLAGALSLAALVQYIELKQFEVTNYKYKTRKVSKKIRLAVLADLHGVEFGKENSRLVHAVKESCPDLILIPGDYITAEEEGFYRKKGYPLAAIQLLKELLEVAPVYYAMGNHESRLAAGKDMRGHVWNWYQKQAKAAGVYFLRNKSELLSVNGDLLEIGGLEIDLSYYAKMVDIHMRDHYIESIYPKKKKEEAFQIIMAHNPVFFEQYLDLQPDLILSGHTHGGLVRIPGYGSVISPELKLFPNYDAGRYDREGASMFVSRGLGTHTYPIRIFNRAELMTIDLEPV
jgi:uncharacterized protein